MSSKDAEYGQDFHQEKKRRTERACDVCRRRKSRCNGSQTAGDKCFTCIDLNLDCTYLEGAPKRVPDQGYVESIETRLEKSEALVRQLRLELAQAHFSKYKVPTSAADSTTDTEPKSTDGYNASLHILQASLRSLSTPAPPPHADDLVHLEIIRKLEHLHVGNPHGRHFVGKSSGAALITAAIDFTADVPKGTGSETGERNGEGFSRGLPWTSRRLQYWAMEPGAITAPRAQKYSFPPPDLAVHLIDLYFTHVNMYLPLLHRPTFERSVRLGLHHRDDGFAVILLLVCAVGSRYSSDPRVVPEGLDTRKTRTGPLACGWEWFAQVSLVEKHLFRETTLYDLQYYSLAVQFLEGACPAETSWKLIGVGLRLAQDAGAHRRNSRVEQPSVERELWKRAFWVLVYLDRALSAGIGRACAIQYYDIDLDFALECDDEYWEHPTQPFQQPPGVPSRIAFFNSLLRLNHILSFSLNILYASLSKARAVFAIDDAWEEKAVMELDSALNSWREEVPEHLRWDPARADDVFFDQSVALQCAYCHLQILIHRPFIPMVRKSAPTALPSLAICTSAARACAKMVDVQRQRKGNVPVVFNLHTAFTSGIILLLNVWSGRRTGVLLDSSRELANVYKCMEAVRLCEDRWQLAGLFWDILWELASAGQLPLNPTANPPLPRSQDHPYAHVKPMAPADTLFGSRAHGPRETFDRPIHDAQFRSPCAPAPQASFAGGVGGGPGTFGPSPMAPSTFAPAPPPDAWFPPEDTFPGNNGNGNGDAMDDLARLIDSDTIAMWTNAPTGFQVDDWGAYFSNFSEITQGQQVYGEMGMSGH
ncbi:fungal-specific transcription factor domain-containing protein [Mycena epipterygia]|nr:fungal-specific transcription factor domain-containing protein [Mycena epipterygia]